MSQRNERRLRKICGNFNFVRKTLKAYIYIVTKIILMHSYDDDIKQHAMLKIKLFLGFSS